MGKNGKKFVGAHVSIAGGVENAPLNAAKIGAHAFAMFTKNQRQWASKPLGQENIEQFRQNLKKSKIRPEHVLPHDGYLINLGNADQEKRKKSADAFLDEIQRVELLGLELLNFHPGSHLNQISEKESLKLISDCLNIAIDQTQNAVLVIENTAGQGTNLGYSFEHLAQIIEQVKNKKRIGVCLDTCHMFSAGYDISTISSFDKVMKQFDKVIGFGFLKGMHLNDSKVELGKRVDRHESLGEGTIGIDAFRFILEDPRFDNIPLILETPDDSKWPTEIKTLMGFSSS